MKVLEFLERLQTRLKRLNRSIVIIEKIDESNNSNYHTLQNLKGIFYHINFDCRIGKDGSECKNYKGIRNIYTAMCCCDNCLEKVGYLDVLTKHPSYFSRKFNSKTGFWRKESGCVLPIEHRSITCITHHCNHEWLSNYKCPSGIPLYSFSEGMEELKHYLKELEFQAITQGKRVMIQRNSYKISSGSMHSKRSQANKS